MLTAHFQGDSEITCFSFFRDMWWIQFLGMMMIPWTLKHPLWPHIEQTEHQQPQMMIWMR